MAKDKDTTTKTLLDGSALRALAERPKGVNGGKQRRSYIEQARPGEYRAVLYAPDGHIADTQRMTVGAGGTVELRLQAWPVQPREAHI